MVFTLCYKSFIMEKEEKIKELLEKYYKRRTSIENSFAYRYNGQVEKRVKNLTNKYTKMLNEL